MSSQLDIDDLSVGFGGVRALSNISICFPAGKIVGIIGPNGAGKTTLLNSICGMLPVNSGRVLLDGLDLVGLAPDAIAARGIRRTFQSSQLFPSMTVLENMMTGMHLMAKSGFLSTVFRTGSHRREEEEMRDRAMEALEFVGFSHFADRPGNALSFGQQRIIEIARTLIFEAKVVLLDEPAVGLSVNRVNELAGLLQRMRDERGVTLIMIEHVIRLVMGVADHIVVLNSGRKIAEGSPDLVRDDPQVIKAYLGGHMAAR
jgi:branched-chain amino acid transport system ATP-binding protein